MQLANEFHIAFYAGALTIAITVLLFTILQKRTDRKQNKVFISMIFVIIANALSTTAAAISEPYAKLGSQAAVNVLEISQFSYFFLHTALCPILYYYVLCVTGRIRKRPFITNLITTLPLLITEVFVLLNPLIHCVYYYDLVMQFHRNWAEYLIYGVAALYFILAMIQLLFSWNAITVRRRIALVYFFVLSLAGILIQLFNINIKSELFAEAIALMGVMLAVESEDDRLDADTGIYNRKALLMDVNNFLIMKETVPLIFIKVVNADIIERITGSANDNLLTDIISEFLMKLVPRYRIYHPNPETFVLTCPASDGIDASEVESCLRERFLKTWEMENTSFLLQAALIRTTFPGELKNAEDVMYIADSILPASTDAASVNVEYLQRRAEIERSIKRSLREEKFEVYYQPTYHLSDLSLHGAEALVRMQDDTIGFVSPEEFIPIAEQIGMVEEIDDFVLRQVCSFLESGIPSERGLSCINVNLSVIQCLRPGFFEHIMAIVEKFRITPSMLNFEITESVGAEDYKVLSEVAGKLKEKGFHLSMDDYGTGYSNIEGIFSLDFDVVKIDKSILWSAEKNANGYMILKNSVNMIHDLGCKVLTEGVETKEQIGLLRGLDVDFLQGFYFSKPVPKREFLQVIE